ncbi:MAG TPA: glycosyltransferase [Rhizomicrobium sp.]|jgi:glycosyltransferase involved in cell wall biosynthesis|nr:glycosyltransferase [Rhizomicrobium sp.]
MPLRVMTVAAGAEFGGSETFFVSLTLALKRARVDVRAAMKSFPIREDAFRAAGIATTAAPFLYPPLDFYTPWRIRRAAERFRPDCVLTFTGRGGAMTPPGPYALIGRLGGYYRLEYFERCNYLVCITPDLVRHVVENGFPKERVFFIPNFPVIQDTAAIDRAAFDTPKDGKLALALGRLHKSKALDVLLKATAQVPDLWLWIAGEGPDRAELTQLAADLGIANRVRFLGWRTDRSALLRASDLCVFPSRYEPNGTVVVEAWAHGVPLVTAASAGPAWIARDGEDALIAPVDDADGLAERMRAVLASPELAAKLVANGHRRIEGEFSEAAVVKRYIDMFEAVRPERL